MLCEKDVDKLAQMFADAVAALDFARAELVLSAVESLRAAEVTSR
jgi:hypothetical protein